MNLNKIKKILNNNIENILLKLNIEYEILGDNIYSKCPIHESSDNPRAFSFCKRRGIWKCWTRDCQHEYKNDVFGLIRGVLSNFNGKSADFDDVLNWINKELNLNIVSIENNPTHDENEFENIVSILREKHIECILPESKLDNNIQIPSPYFIDRGFKPATLKYFGVGDCYDKNSKLFERAIIPIHSDCGSLIIGYTCRSIRDYKIPKFLIYPKGFNKRFVFYNMHRAMPYIKQSNSVFIVEGQGDLWKLYEAGVYNVIGMFGKTLSKEQQAKLNRLPLTHIIILTDNDQAGRESKIQLQRQLGRFYRLTFPQLNHKDIGEMSISQIKQEIVSKI